MTSVTVPIAFLPAATKLGQGNIFTRVCDSVNRGVGGWSGPGGLQFFGGSPIFHVHLYLKESLGKIKMNVTIEFFRSTHEGS